VGPVRISPEPVTRLTLTLTSPVAVLTPGTRAISLTQSAGTGARSLYDWGVPPRTASDCGAPTTTEAAA
jgi:hypothetical protein